MLVCLSSVGLFFFVFAVLSAVLSMLIFAKAAYWVFAAPKSTLVAINKAEIRYLKIFRRLVQGSMIKILHVWLTEVLYCDKATYSLYSFLYFMDTGTDNIYNMGNAHSETQEVIKNA